MVDLTFTWWLYLAESPTLIALAINIYKIKKVPISSKSFSNLIAVVSVMSFNCNHVSTLFSQDLPSVSSPYLVFEDPGLLIPVACNIHSFWWGGAVDP